MSGPAQRRGGPGWRRHPALPFVLPFAVYVAALGIERAAAAPLVWGYPVRCLLALAALAAVSRRATSWRPAAPWASAAVGAAVFLIWIAPDAFFGAAYRQHGLFANSLAGRAVSSVPEALRSSAAFVALRLLGCAALVPLLEELFWRGWLMRWLQDRRFLRVPLGAYSRLAFWTVAIAFAAEHGPYWDVGLAAGIVYNWWIVRTKSLGSVTLAHAVTNTLLSAYVLASGNWQYWM